ncbi:MAG: signal recognition particle-docking protein FtsY [Flavobacteriaceae bacterium]|nr:signal recognition particle-docking protein FtsY [Flavobacteriaceae bacterium]OUV84532.1 MAG: signal recognition particle-docking protein FtsY [Flavobacteriaceae bacterium TMED145]|tara:strand:+ start:6601 stop:7776 length:1176 start_codon:yes stop_codon:yes gene_type:complete
MGLFDKFFSLFKKKKDKEPSTDEKEKNKPEEIEEISETISKSEPEPEPEPESEPDPEPEPESEPEPEPELEPEPEPVGFFKNIYSKKKKDTLNKGLKKSNQSFFSKLNKLVIGKTKIDSDVLDNLEEVLISSDVGVNTTLKIIDKIESRVAEEKYSNLSELNILLKAEIASLLIENEEEPSNNNTFSEKPHVIMVVGVNGVGKTTTIGKLANKYKKLGLKVVIGAADTFRAAAIDQLVTWANRVDVPIIKQQMGSDPASVAFDTLNYAKTNDADLVLIDTAGRLHNKINLMNELSKIKRVMNRVIENAPHDVMLVLDGSTGQNAFIQAKEFTNTTEVSSLTITKLDGTAKGGVVIGISDEFKIPVKYIGVGEALEDLQEFNKLEFVDSFFD